MNLEITASFILLATIILKFIFGKILIEKNKIIIKSYFHWFSIYDFEVANTSEEKMFYKFSNIFNFIIWLFVCVLLIVLFVI